VTTEVETCAVVKANFIVNFNVYSNISNAETLEHRPSRFSMQCNVSSDSDSQLVNSVARYAVWYGRMTSSLGSNTFHRCRRYGSAVDDVCLATPAGISRAVESSYDIVEACTARMILELVFICCGFFKVQ